MDIVTKNVRSKMMSGIRSRDTRPEVLVRKHLHSIGLRFRKNQRLLDCRPDLVLKQWKTCIFIHGCYWHRHTDCRLASTPKSNTDFWTQKFKANTERDLKNYNKLSENGWKVGIIWECATRNESFLNYDYRYALENFNFWVVE